MPIFLDAGQFCEFSVLDKNANAIEFMWAEPREIQQIELVIEMSHELENAILKAVTGTSNEKAQLSFLKIQYWVNHWPSPQKEDEELLGAGLSGWQSKDDWYKGTWKDADVTIEWNLGDVTNEERGELNCKVTFGDVSLSEFPNYPEHLKYRKTLKFRLKLLPPYAIDSKFGSVQFFTTSQLDLLKFVVFQDPTRIASSGVPLRLQMFNGFLSRVAGRAVPSATVEMAGGQFGDEIEALVTNRSPLNSPDETLITITAPNSAVREEQNNPFFLLRPFTFSVEDLKKHEAIFLPDLGFLVCLVKPEGITLYHSYPEAEEGFHAQCPDSITPIGGEIEGERPDIGNATVYDRLFSVPEQTLRYAMEEFESKEPFYTVIGFEGVRTKAAVDLNGEIFTSRGFLRSVPGRDTSALYWKKALSRIRFQWNVKEKDIPDEIFRRPSSREVEKGFLPIITTGWQIPREEVQITQVAFASLLEGVKDNMEPEGDAHVAALVQFSVFNSSPEAVVIKFAIRLEECASIEDADSSSSALFSNATLNTYNDAGDALIRFYPQGMELDVKVEVPPSGVYSCILKELKDYTHIATGGTIELEFSAAPGVETKFELYLPLLAPPGVERPLKLLDFDGERRLIRRYWRKRIKNYGHIEVPPEIFSQFYKAQLIHTLITNDQAILDNEEEKRIIGRVGSLRYGCYANEVCMIVMDLNRRGLFNEARRMLDTFIQYQGTVGLDGDYETMDGIYYGAGGYESGASYNQHHGFVLWAIVDYVRLSGDQLWFQTIMPSVISACQWILTEIRLFKSRIPGRYSAEDCEIRQGYSHRQFFTGLLPPGGVEDIGDFWFWLSTNAYNAHGLILAATLLLEFEHPEALKLIAGARDYIETVRNLFLRAMELTPVVNLRNGIWIPHIPCRIPLHGRGYGWIEEVLEGALHLLRCDILSPFSQESTWILQDLEDNLFLSENFGYPLVDEQFNRYWFSRGGFSMQPFLLCNHMIYAIRKESKHFLRAFFNAFSVNFRPDTCMFTEHPLPSMFDWRGDHFKTSDEAQWATAFRTMLIQEVQSVIETQLSHAGFVKTPFPPANLIEKRFKIDNYPLANSDKIPPPDGLSFFALVPREWLKDEQVILARDMPTIFGSVTVKLESHVKEGFVGIWIERNRRGREFVPPLKYIFITIRHPDPLKPITSVKFFPSDSEHNYSEDAEIRISGMEIRDQWLMVPVGDLMTANPDFPLHGIIQFAPNEPEHPERDE